MTKEQWRVIDKALKEYEEYGRRVQEYLLFLLGEHPESEIDKVMEDAPKQIEIVKKDIQLLKNCLSNLLVDMESLRI